MNIKTLRVQNFKNFEDKTFEFSEGFNLIIGDNGTGKTALLEALSCLFSGFLLNSENEEKIIFPKMPSILPKNSSIRVKSVFQGETLNLEFQYPCKIHCSLEWNDDHLEQTVDAPKSGLVFNGGGLSALAIKLTANVRNGDSIVLPIISFYSTARLWLEKIEGLEESNQVSLFDDEVIKLSSRLDGYKNALDVAISNKSWLRWFMRMELISLQNKKPMKVFEAVKKALQACLEGCDLLYFDVQRGEPIARIHGNPMPFSLLSDGQRSMLAMVADIAYRMAQLNPHLLENVTLETPGVVLIDELDLHLHPKWQRKVVDNLRKAFPKVQFFATTHSPFIIQSVRLGELIDLNENVGVAEYQDKSIEDIAEQVQGVYMPQRSQRELEMLAAAKEYYRVLEQTKDAKDLELKTLKERLDTLSEPYAEDIAYIAFLEAKRLSALKERA